jgi:hypothetical protein
MNDLKIVNPDPEAAACALFYCSFSAPATHQSKVLCVEA